MKSRIKKKKEKRICGFCKHFFQDEGFCKGECCKTGSNRWSTDNACLSYKLEKCRKTCVMENPMDSVRATISAENLTDVLQRMRERANKDYPIAYG